MRPGPYGWAPSPGATGNQLKLTGVKLAIFFSNQCDKQAGGSLRGAGRDKGERRHEATSPRGVGRWIGLSSGCTHQPGPFENLGDATFLSYI